MSGLVAPTTATRPLPVVVDVGAPATDVSGHMVLPSAAPLSIGGMQDVLSALYLVISALRDDEVRSGQTRISSEKGHEEAALAEKRSAEKRAEGAARRGGLFDAIARDVGLAGAIGLLTFDYALVAADVCAHELGIVGNLKVDCVDAGAFMTGRVDVLAADVVLRKLEITPDVAKKLVAKAGIPEDAPGISDADVQPVAKKLVMANLLVASATASVLSCGTTAGLTIAAVGLAMSLAGSYVAEHKVFGAGPSEWVGLGMEIYGALASGMSGLAPGGAAIEGAAVAGVINGGLDVVRGGDRIVSAVHRHEADEANVDAEAAKQKIARLERVLDMIIDGIRETRETHQKTQEIIQNVIQSVDVTNVTLANATRV